MARGASRYPRRKPKRNAWGAGRRRSPPHATPLDYALAVMDDPAADPKRRDRMALAALTYRHARLESVADKEEQPRMMVERYDWWERPPDDYDPHPRKEPR